MAPISLFDAWQSNGDQASRKSLAHRVSQLVRKDSTEVEDALRRFKAICREDYLELHSMALSAAARSSLKIDGVNCTVELLLLPLSCRVLAQPAATAIAPPLVSRHQICADIERSLSLPYGCLRMAPYPVPANSRALSGLRPVHKLSQDMASAGDSSLLEPAVFDTEEDSDGRYTLYIPMAHYRKAGEPLDVALTSSEATKGYSAVQMRIASAVEAELQTRYRVQSQVVAFKPMPLVKAMQFAARVRVFEDIRKLRRSTDETSLEGAVLEWKMRQDLVNLRIEHAGRTHRMEWRMPWESETTLEDLLKQIGEHEGVLIRKE